MSATLAVHADPPSRYIDAAVFDYFLIEAIDTLRASAAVADARAKKIETEMIDAHILPPPPPPKDHPPDDEEDALRVRLEAIGMHIGANFSERCVSRVARSLRASHPASDYARINLSSPRPSMLSNSCAKTSGLHFGRNK
jgi:hypothetical protein